MSGDTPSAQSTKLRIYGIAVCFNGSYLMLAFLVPLYALHLGYSVVTIGFLAALPSLLQIPLRTVSGALTDTWGELPLLRVAFLACLASAVALAAVASSFAMLAAAQLAVGVARSLYWVPIQSYLSRQPGNRARALGILSSTNNAGALCGILAAGPLAGVGYPTAFGAATLFAAAALAGTFLLPPVPVQGKGFHTFAASMRMLPRALGRADLFVCGLVSLVAAVPQALVQSFYPVYIAHLGAGATEVSVITAMRSGGMICIGFFVARLYRRLGWRGSFALAGGAMALSLLVTASGRPLGLLALGVLLAGATSGVLAVLSVHMAIEASDDENRGTHIAIVNMYFAVTMFAVPFGFGLVAARIGLAGTFVLLGAVVALSTGAVAAVWRRAWPRRRTTGPVSESGATAPG